jgi:uncharacterized protein (DUF2235 family)
MKRLIVCCDGTWQKLTSPCPTNVVKIAQAIKPIASDGTPQVLYYDEGVRRMKGTDFSAVLLAEDLTKISKMPTGFFASTMWREMKSTFLASVVERIRSGVLPE